jgi:hypothetical protein
MVSTGLPYLSSAPNTIPTDTPRGNFTIHAKRPAYIWRRHPALDAEAYELPGVRGFPILNLPRESPFTVLSGTITLA